MGSRKVPEKLAPYTVRMPAAVLKALQAEAVHQDRSVNSLAIRALRAYLANPEAAEGEIRKAGPKTK